MSYDFGIFVAFYRSQMYLTGRRYSCLKVITSQCRIGHGDLMIKATEKRTDRRHDCDVQIKWTQFNQPTFNFGQDIFYPARVLNFSQSGLYFESEYPLKQGTTILFRLETSGCGVLDSEGYECLRTISLAEVKWCQYFLENGESYFGIGARYPTIPY